jgi:hypothetical protein
MADVERRATVEQMFSIARREAKESVLDRDQVRGIVREAADELRRERQQREPR